MSRHISSRLELEQVAYARSLLEHPCFANEDYVSLLAVRLASGKMRLTLQTPWEYRRTFYATDEHSHRRIMLQLAIYAEYCRAFDCAMDEAKEVDGSDAWDAYIDWQPRIDRIRGPIELRSIAPRYLEEIQTQARKTAGTFGSDKIRTADRRLVIGFDGDCGVLPAVSYIRYEQDDFAIIYTDGRTRIEMTGRLPESVVDGGDGLTMDKVLGPGFGRDAQKVLGIETKKSRTIINVETILCLCAPNSSI